jgi:hypothetical protein
MSFTTQMVSFFFSSREREIDRFRRFPAEVQQAQFDKLIAAGRQTLFGRRHGFDTILNVDDFRRQVPVSDYETIKEWINRSRTGEKAVLWPSDIRWYARSSGTTGDQSKYIPVSDDGLSQCHLQGPKDVLGMVAGLYPDSDFLDGKTLTLGGSHRFDPLGGGAQSGDLSAILIENTPAWAAWKRLPKRETALTADFEEKILKICEETVDKKVTAFAGVPSWNLVMVNKILQYTGKSNLSEVWPDLELFIHGGMSFEPYREQYRQLIPSPRMKYVETYNASEGFFGIQDDPGSAAMLLMLDYGVFYEFIPAARADDVSLAVPLEGVRLGENYAVVISTNSGLWRYRIGDTIEFTSLNPFKFRFTGRTKLFINAFGEEIIIDNAEAAMREACLVTGARVTDYTAAPVYMTANEKGAHQWLIEFSTPPADPALFAETLDRKLQEVNSDYQAKRHKDATLHAPVIVPLRCGAFYDWMAERGKLGGQNKVPRLANDRKYADQLLKYKL